MPSVQVDELSNVTGMLTITLEPKDYSSKIKDELKKLRKKSNMKGFRAGQAPMSIIRKMYGKNVVYEAVNGLLQTEVGEYLDSIDRKTMGQPIPVESDELVYDFSVKGSKGGYVFKFKIGYEPEFELKGYDAETTIDYYNVSIKDEVIDKEIENIQKRLGKQEEVFENIEDKDVITVELEELNEAGDGVKEGGVTGETKIAVDLMPEATREKVLAMKSGDTFEVDVYQLDTKVVEKDDVVKYFFTKESEEEGEEATTTEVAEFGNMFKATISEVERFVPAELNEETFKDAFPQDEITDEAGARAKMTEEISKFYTEQADSLFMGIFQRNLLEVNNLEMPEEFLKEWLALSNEKTTQEEIEKDFPNFLKGLQWSIVQSKIAEKEGIEVSKEDLRAAVRAETVKYFGGEARIQEMGLGEDFFDGMVDRMMEDQNSLNQQAEKIVNERISAKAKEVVTLNIIEVDNEGFDEAVKAYNEELQAAENAAALVEAIVDEQESANEEMIVDAEVVEENETAESNEEASEETTEEAATSEE